MSTQLCWNVLQEEKNAGSILDVVKHYLNFTHEYSDNGIILL